MISTPIYDQLVLERGQRFPGQLTRQDLEELMAYQATLELPDAIEVGGPEPEIDYLALLLREAVQYHGVRPTTS